MDIDLTDKCFAGIKYPKLSCFGPFIMMKPSFGLTVNEIKPRIKPGVKIPSSATIILEGQNSTIDEDIEPDTLTTIINGVRTSKPKRTIVQEIDPSLEKEEIYAMRGFKFL